MRGRKGRSPRLLRSHKKRRMFLDIGLARKLGRRDITRAIGAGGTPAPLIAVSGQMVCSGGGERHQLHSQNRHYERAATTRSIASAIHVAREKRNHSLLRKVRKPRVPLSDEERGPRTTPAAGFFRGGRAKTTSRREVPLLLRRRGERGSRSACSSSPEGGIGLYTVLNVCLVRPLAPPPRPRRIAVSERTEKKKSVSL